MTAPHRHLSLKVVGADFPNRKPRTRGQIPRRFEIQACAPGEPVSLVVEPDNPADSSAIMVFSKRDIQIGYVTAERAPLIGKHIRQGDDIVGVFQAAAEWGAWIRVSLDGSQPQLPIMRESKPPDASDYDGYYADPIWPDD